MGQVFVREKSTAYYVSMESKQGPRKFDIYEVCFGADKEWFDVDLDFFVPVLVYIKDDGSIKWEFVRPRQHVLDKTSEKWLTLELEEIIVMYKLGGFCSDKSASTHPADDSKHLWDCYELHSKRRKK